MFLGVSLGNMIPVKIIRLLHCYRIYTYVQNFERTAYNGSGLKYISSIYINLQTRAFNYKPVKTNEIKIDINNVFIDSYYKSV